MPPPWVTLLELISNGEAVDAATPNRPLTQLAQRTEYLKSLVDAISSASGAFDTDASVSDDVEEGMAVYWNSATQQYDLALAALDYDGAGVYGSIADSSYVLGVCVSKSSANRGTIQFSGRADEIDFSTAIDGTLTAGPYFLSSTEPGKLTQVRPPVGIHVLFGLYSDSSVSASAVIMPTPREVLEDHIHYAVTLSYGMTISTSAGWSTVYEVDLAPANTRYRYTVEEDDSLSTLFPFLPPEAVYFEIDGIGANDKVEIDMNGIWWVDADNDPSDYQTMTAYYAKPTAKTSSTTVTSLRPWSSDSILTFVDCNGNSSTAGDLYAKLALAFSTGDTPVTGWDVFKEVTAGGKFKSGPVVESVRSASSQISVGYESVDGTQQGADASWGGKQGRLVLTYNDPSTDVRVGMPQLTSLNNATQEDVSGIPYVALPSAYTASITYSFDVPTENAGLTADSYTLYFQTWVLATVAGVLPTISVSYTLVQAASLGSVTNLSANTTGTGSLSGLPTGSVSSNDYIIGIFRPGPTAPVGITVEPGDQLHVTLSRADAGSPSYAGNVGFMRTLYRMESA